MPRTLVAFHAHPDDEVIATGGVIARAVAQGHRVVVVFATRGEHGEVADDVLAPGEALGARRTREAHDAAAILGIDRVEFLDYVDSGMAGTPENEAPGSFWTADVDDAARRLATILDEERPDVLTIYDENGVYGHPDHVQVHRVGLRAAASVPVPHIFEATMNRDSIRRVMLEHREALRDEHGQDPPGLEDPDRLTIGVPESEITTGVDVRGVIEVKRAALAAHASQVSETSFFLTMAPTVFREVFGDEWFLHRGSPPGLHERWIFDDEPPAVAVDPGARA